MSTHSSHKDGNITAILDSFIPRALRKQINTRVRARVLVSLMLFSIAISPLGQALLYFSRSSQQEHLSRGHLILTIVTIMAIGALWLFKRHGKLEALGSFFIASSYLAICVPSFLLEDAPIVLLQVLYILPAFAFMICRFKVAVGWNVVIMITHLYLLLQAGGNDVDMPLGLAMTTIIYLVLATTYGSYNIIQLNMSTQLQKERNSLDYQAHHDSLTELSNRSAVEEFLERALSGAANSNEIIGLLYIDLDKFKPINDTYGHAAGDDVLKEVAKILRHTVRRGDIAARIGGDEFILVLRDINSELHAVRVAEKIRDSLLKPILTHGQNLELGASIGICLYPEHGKDQTELLKNADQAMYQAKNNNLGIATFKKE